MKSLSQALEGSLVGLKKIQELKRQETKNKSKTKKEFLDFRHLNATNLELENLVYQDAPFFQCKELPQCGRCEGGYIPERVGHIITSRLCKFCEIPRRKMNQLTKLQLPSDSYGMHFKAYEWDSPKQQERVQGLLDWMQQPKNREIQASPSLYLRGDPGNGKTSLLYCMAKEAVFSGLKVVYISHNQLIDQIKRSYSGDKDPLKHWLDDIDLLLFDEFCGVGGGANQTNWFKSTTADIVQKIYERWKSGKLSVILTSNLTNQQLKTAIDHNKAILSRFIAMFGEPITMIGQDRRIQNSDLLQSWIG